MIAGLVGGFSDASPTGANPLDHMLVGLGIAVVAWVAASAPWWVLGAIASATMLVSGDPWVAVLALSSFVLAIAIGLRQRDQSSLRVLSAGLTLNALVRAQFHGFFAATAIVGSIVVALLFATAVRRRPRRVRRVVWALLGTTMGIVVIALAGAFIAVLGARTPLRDGNRAARQGLSAVNRGDYTAAADHFASAEAAFRRADDHFTAPWAQLSRVVPVLAQHMATGREVSAGAQQASATMTATLHTIDIGSVKVHGGRIDLAAVAALQRPIGELQQALGDLTAAVDQAASPWLVAPVQRELGSLHKELDKNQVRLDNAAAAIEVAPALLGAQGTRHYLVLFTTPAEARGVSGLPGNFAELTVTNGRISMTRFARLSALNLGGSHDRYVTCCAEFVRRYGRFGFDNPTTGAVASYVWSNITLSPDFPTVAKLAMDLYPQSGGDHLDGVMMMDPFTLQTMLAYTGPVTVEGWAQPLTSKNAAKFLLVDQYVIPSSAQRADLLEQAARTTLQKLLAGSLPSPVRLAHDLGPLVAEGRLRFWTPQPAEADMLERTHLAGGFPTPPNGDGAALVVANAGPNKLTGYLERSVQRSSVTDPTSHITNDTYAITFTSTAPTSGLPKYVTGTPVKGPVGTNRLFTCFYSPLSMTSATVDGATVGMETDTELGWKVYCRYIDVEPQKSTTLTIHLQGVVGSAGHTPSLVKWVQPLVLPQAWTDLPG
ncbi:MAG: DUF4012 domain-containing protein [Actinomycetota bacterium]